MKKIFLAGVFFVMAATAQANSVYNIPYRFKFDLNYYECKDLYEKLRVQETIRDIGRDRLLTKSFNRLTLTKKLTKQGIMGKYELKSCVANNAVMGRLELIDFVNYLNVNPIYTNATKYRISDNFEIRVKGPLTLYDVKDYTMVEVVRNLFHNYFEHYLTRWHSEKYQNQAGNIQVVYKYLTKSTWNRLDFGPKGASALIINGVRDPLIFTNDEVLLTQNGYALFKEKSNRCASREMCLQLTKVDKKMFEFWKDCQLKQSDNRQCQVSLINPSGRRTHTSSLSDTLFLSRSSSEVMEELRLVEQPVSMFLNSLD